LAYLNLNKFFEVKGMRSLPILMCCGLLSSLVAAPTLTHAESLPIRETPIPQTTDGVPHVQIGTNAAPELAQALTDHVASFPGVKLGPTRVSMPGGIGFQLDEDVALSRPDVIVGGREFAHLHTDGSLHASLNPDVALVAIEAGWAVAHPWAKQREGWGGFVMIFTPTTSAELEVVIQLVESSYNFVTGQVLPE
jgi:phospholipase/carboxylesterase